MQDRGLSLRSSSSAARAIFLSVFFFHVTGESAEEKEDPDFELRAFHIVVATKEEAYDVRREIRSNGGDLKAFRKAAREHSKDPTTRPSGGDLGWKSEESDLEQAFLKALFALEERKMSGPVRTTYGWHLVFLAETRGDADIEKRRKIAARLEASPVEGDMPVRTTDPEARRVVERYLKVIGGKDVLAAITDRTIEYDNKKVSATGANVARIACYLKRGGKYREEWEIPGFQVEGQALAFTQVYDGEEGWVKMTGTVSRLEGQTLTVFLWDKWVDDFFVHWEPYGYSLRKIDDGFVGDERAQVIEATDLSGRQDVRYFFSKRNGLLLKKEWRDKAEEPSTKEMFFRRYAPIEFSDGSGRSLRVAMRREIYVDGQLDTERTYKEIAFNRGLPDELFAKPEGKEFRKK